MLVIYFRILLEGQKESLSTWEWGAGSLKPAEFPFSMKLGDTDGNPFFKFIRLVLDGGW